MVLPQVTTQDELQVSPVKIVLRPDVISQEGNETFTLTFHYEEGDFGNSPTLHNTLTGTIIDATGTNLVIGIWNYKYTETNRDLRP